MAKNYFDVAFTDSVKAQQEKHASRQQYARMEQRETGTELTFSETDFIQSRDGFYLATVGENDFPYVQFRGGPAGFLQVLDTQTLAFADFRGNRQYISIGNLAHNDRAALILMDYPQRARLKLYARLRVVDAAEDPALIQQLTLPDYAAKVERAMVLTVEAFDWNCPQHITQRYSLAEVRALNQPLYQRIAELEAEVARLKSTGV